MPPGNGELFVTLVGGNDDVAKSVSQLFKPYLGLVKEVLSLILRKIEFRVGVVMIKDIFDSESFERQRNEKYVVWSISSLDYLKTAHKENPPGIQILPKQSARIFQ